jgi:hypothetical protein
VLADSERDGYLPAFNQAFAEAGLPVRWSEEEYSARLQIGGGKERMASALTPGIVRDAGLPADPDALRDWIAALHARKTAIFGQIVRAGELPARAGVVRLVDEAIAAGVRRPTGDGA